MTTTAPVTLRRYMFPQFICLIAALIAGPISLNWYGYRLWGAKRQNVAISACWRQRRMNIYIKGSLELDTLARIWVSGDLSRCMNYLGWHLPFSSFSAGNVWYNSCHLAGTRPCHWQQRGSAIVFKSATERGEQNNDQNSHVKTRAGKRADKINNAAMIGFGLELMLMTPNNNHDK